MQCAKFSRRIIVAFLADHEKSSGEIFETANPRKLCASNIVTFGLKTPLHVIGERTGKKAEYL